MTWAALAILMAASVVVGGYAAGPDAAPRARLSTITATAGARGTSVLIEASEPVAYATARPDPLTLLVDLRHATTAGAVNRLAATPVGGVAAVTLEDVVASDGAPVARVRLLLAAPATPAVHSDRNTIQVDVAPGGGVVPPPQVAAPGPQSPPPAATRIEAISTSPAAPVEVVLKGNGALTATKSELTSGKPYRLVLDFAGVASGVARSTLVNKGAITRIRVAPNSVTPLVTRVVFDLTGPVSYTLQPQANELKVTLAGVAGEPAAAAGTAAEKKPAVARAAAPKKAGPSRPTAAVVPASRKASRHAGPPAAAARGAGNGAPETAAPAENKPAADTPAAPQASKPAAAPPPAAAAPPPQLPPGMTGSSVGQPTVGRQYSGHPISLDFQGADLRSVLRIFSVDTGLNIVIDPAVQGSVDVALRDVPWDQALDIILRANKLGWVADGTIIRVAPLTVLAEEEAQRRKLADEQALSGELNVMTHTLSYAKAEEVRSLLTTALTKRGEVQVDPRTNTVIIRDLPVGIDTARGLLTTLDRPQPQVEIEARIVQTSRDFARKIGVQWGFQGRVAPELGNTTGLAFPSSVVAGGAASGGSVVNMPVNGATSAVGIALGSVNGAFNLDVALSALENSGKGRILSTPRVSTQNNVEAEVMQGTQIPIQTIANNTVTVQFKDAALTLKVTPQITASNTVIMNITLENAAPDYSRQVGPNGIPPIDTQRAKTTVLVKDGDTTVIGGIYVSQEQASTDRTPGISRIPLLGWLFKREALNDTSRELLIFITPRIAKL